MESEKKDNNDNLIEDKYYKLIDKKELLKDKRNNLESELKQNNTQYEEYYQDLIKINFELDQLNEKLQKAINENDELNNKNNNNALINSEDIRKICSECFEEFFMDSINLLNVSEIEIRYRKIVIFKQITNASMSFKDLKEETKSQFDREIDEFFFVDQENRIYLDNMNVKKALFPLEKIAIKNTIPKIYLKDLFIYEIYDNFNKVPEIMDKDTIGVFNYNKQEISFLDKIKINLFSNRFTYVNIITYTLFVVFWALSCIEFRSLGSFFLISRTFDKKILNPGSSNVQIYFFLLLKILILNS